MDQGEGLPWRRANVAWTDWWLSDFPVGDGDEKSVVAGLAAEKGSLEVLEERCVGGDRLGRLVCQCLDDGVSFFSPFF